MQNQEKVTIFTMNQYISKHLVQKLDKSAYVHEEDEDVKAVEVNELEEVQQQDVDSDATEEEVDESDAE